jgi:hypothetical protein
MLSQCLMFIWWDSLLKIVLVCIMFPNMSIHVGTMFDVHMAGLFTKDCSNVHNLSKYVNICCDNVCYVYYVNTSLNN